MISKIVVVRDRAIDSFGTPFFVQALGQAVRSFTDEVNRADSELGRHSEDYDLYEIGEFDSDTGAVNSMERPRMIAVGKDVKIRSE